MVSALLKGRSHANSSREGPIRLSEEPGNDRNGAGVEASVGSASSVPLRRGRSVAGPDSEHSSNVFFETPRMPSRHGSIHEMGWYGQPHPSGSRSGEGRGVVRGLLDMLTQGAVGTARSVMRALATPVWAISLALLASFVVQLIMVSLGSLPSDDRAAALSSSSSSSSVEQSTRLASRADEAFDAFVSLAGQRGAGPVTEALFDRHMRSMGVDPGQVFNVSRAWQDLEVIARDPHSFNDERVLPVREYLLSTIRAEIEVARRRELTLAAHSGGKSKRLARLERVEVDDAGSDPERAFGLLHPQTWRYIEDGSILVLVPGLESFEKEGADQDMLLVQAHYDSASLSRGASDDGVGVVVILEVLRNLLRYPTRHSVLLNIDWGEEKGLFGAELFARFHPWARAVRAYINLEAGGVGGKAILFRASNTELVEAYARVARNPDMSLFGNDALKLKLIRSDTDYSTYTRFGIPGLDIAFTDRRGFYHTRKDSPDMTSKGSILHMGSSTLATAREIADSDLLLRIPRSPVYRDSKPEYPPYSLPDGSHPIAYPEPPGITDTVFYDIFMWAAYAYSFEYQIFLDALYVAAAAALLAVVVWKRVPTIAGGVAVLGDGVTYRTLYRFNLVQLLRYTLLALFSWLAAFFAAGVVVGGVALMVNPQLPYQHPTLQLLAQFSGAFAAGVWIQSMHMIKDERDFMGRVMSESESSGSDVACRPDAKERAQSRFRWSWYGIAAFKALLVVCFEIPLSSSHVGVLYQQSWYLLASIVCAGSTAVLDDHIPALYRWRDALLTDNMVYLASSPTPTPIPQGSVDEAMTTSGRNSVEEGEDDEEEGEEVLLLGGQRTTEELGESPMANHLTTHRRLVRFMVAAIATLRFAVGVFLPMLYGLSILNRLLRIIGGGVIDGGSTIPLVAFAGFNMADFALMLLPYVHCCVYINQLPTIRAASVSLQTPPHASQPPAAGEDGYDADGEGDYWNQLPSDAQVELKHTRRTVHKLRSVWLFIAFLSLSLLPICSLLQRGYNSHTCPYKMRVYQQTTIDASCPALPSPTAAGTNLTVDRCLETTLQLLGIDSTVTKLLSPFDWASKRACFPSYPGSLYQCKITIDPTVAHAAPGAQSPSMLTQAVWDPATAVQYNIVRHVVRRNSSESGDTTGELARVHANVSIRASETRTCGVRFGTHLPSLAFPAYKEGEEGGTPFSLHALGDSPVTSWATRAGANSTALSLPTLERAYFVSPRTGSPPELSPLPVDRDPVYMFEVLGHKFQMDIEGKFELRVEYTARVDEKGGIAHPLHGDIWCEFDRSDRHAPLVGRLEAELPDWTSLTPHRTSLSQVVVHNVRF